MVESCNYITIKGGIEGLAGTTFTVLLFLSLWRSFTTLSPTVFSTGCAAPDHNITTWIYHKQASHDTTEILTFKKQQLQVDDSMWSHEMTKILERNIKEYNIQSQ